MCGSFLHFYIRSRKSIVPWKYVLITPLVSDGAPPKGFNRDLILPKGEKNHFGNRIGRGWTVEAGSHIGGYIMVVLGEE